MGLQWIPTIFWSRSNHPVGSSGNSDWSVNSESELFCLWEKFLTWFEQIFWLNLLNIGYVSNETNTDVHMYTWRIYSSRDLDTLLYKLKMMNIGKYTGFYTIATMEEKCENCSWEPIDRRLFKRITMTWETVIWVNKCVKCHSTVCFAPNTCKC